MASRTMKPTAKTMNIPGAIMNQAPWIMKTPGSSEVYHLNYECAGHKHAFAGPRHECVGLSMSLPG